MSVANHNLLCLVNVTLATPADLIKIKFRDQINHGFPSSFCDLATTDSKKQIHKIFKYWCQLTVIKKSVGSHVHFDVCNH